MSMICQKADRMAEAEEAMAQVLEENVDKALTDAKALEQLSAPDAVAWIKTSLLPSSGATKPKPRE